MASRCIAFIALLWELQFCVCREVTLPAGPLYRVAGFPLSLPCAVSGYEGPRTQDFEWYLYREDAGGRQIGVVSTRDAGFPYAPFQSRVQVGEVRVERDSGDKARLIIQRLRPDDQGRYECYTPSTDTRFQGSYSSSVVVKVIPDTLLITHSRILSGQPVIEGTELQLTCAASVQSDQHTHVSVAFGVCRSKGAESQGHNLREIISIDRELRVTPGRSGAYGKRYGDGEIAVEKRRGDGGWDLYALKMSALAPEDSGSYFCEAAQWIRDPDGKWERIAQRTMELGNLTVQPLADTLSVRLLPDGDVSLRPGAPLRLRCQVLGVGAWKRSALQVQWMRHGPEGSVEVEVVRVDPDGVVVWGDDLSGAGGGSMEKEAGGSFSLRLFSVRPVDAGLYRCAVSVYAGRKTPAPESPATITQRSEWVTVSLKTEEVRVSASIGLPRRPLLKRGSTVTLLCNISVQTTGASRVQVQWLQEPARKDAALSEDSRGRLLVTLSYDGLTLIYSNGSSLSVDRVSAGCFRLRIFSAAEEDQGHYRCRAEVWAKDPRGGWYNTGAKAESETVHLYLYARVTDLLLLPLVIGVSSALFVGVLIIATVTCCFMNRLARQRSLIRK
ncbi:immunoglobulin superfamily member 8-like [Sinocyclocheilus anshuiensis]|uniref:Immunoglobulin superfamily member 8-like n=1 Tax=Sinocyclocheilus anshuiensis TaxID=1608454 RepID=A0A671SH45_9TELE|nr:PREDICTED: immunoglobulin superfamily member 8-like [Sinocyclocheilus anshuiensis]